MSHTASTTAAADLQTVIQHWDKLAALIDTSNGTEWPPARGQHGTIRDDHDPDDPADVDHVQHLVTRMHALGTVDYECLHCDYVGEGHGHSTRPDRDPAQLGERPVPIRLHVVDTMRAIEDALVYLADTIAAEIQREPMSRAPRTAGWLPKEIEKRDRLAAADATDTRRWPWPRIAEDAEDRSIRPPHFRAAALGQPRPTRTALGAADWLQDRLANAPGPFLPLGSIRTERIATVTAEAARRICSAIGAERTHRPLAGMPCPGCKGELMFHQGGGEPDIVTCAAGLMDCNARVPWHPDTKRREWDGDDLVELLQKLEAARREIREIRARKAEDERRAKRTAARRRQRAAVREQADAAA